MSDMVEKVREWAGKQTMLYAKMRYEDYPDIDLDNVHDMEMEHHEEALAIILTLLDVVESGEAFIDQCDVMAPEINDRIVHCELVRKFKPLSQNWSKEHKSFRDALTTFEQRIGEILEGGNDDIL